MLDGETRVQRSRQTGTEDAEGTMIMTDATMQAETSAEQSLVDFAAGLRFEDIPAAVINEARRSLINVLATAIAGCREEAVSIAVRTQAPFSGEPTSTLIGRSERGDAATAAFINAMSANIFDFDDTHEATVIHPAAPVFAALFAHGETVRVSGAELLRAFVIGGEVECRIGNALSPYHYAHGWHITSTCGVFGAAAGVGSLVGLDAAKVSHALSVAAVQSCGLVNALGTMAKSASVGSAARNGLISARLAADGFTGPDHPLTGDRGYLYVYGDNPDLTALNHGLGETWEIATNTYKPYPVGVVLNPVLDALLELRERHNLSLDDIASVELTGHPLLQQRTDRADVKTGRLAQVSAQHAIAIVLLRGRAGLEEFTDSAVTETFGRRPPVRFYDDPSREIATALVVLHTRDGTALEIDIPAASGSQGKPMSDAQLETKLTDLAKWSGFKGDTGRLCEAIWSIETLDDVAPVIRWTARDA
jgi:2-methylcitrate dehydratase PrpD